MGKGEGGDTAGARVRAVRKSSETMSRRHALLRAAPAVVGREGKERERKVWRATGTRWPAGDAKRSVLCFGEEKKGGGIRAGREREGVGAAS